ncbi:MAG: mechanosensitive ion channel family protein, partial [Peptostreptococcaceae bacterium]|nr:mechanosensitive ion channel family protein [Peptostreptococcaceae bacterium]
MPQFFSQIYLNNTIFDYLIFLASLVISFTAIKIIGYFLIKRLTMMVKKSETQPDTSQVSNVNSQASSENSQSLEDNYLIKSIKRNILPSAYFAAFYFTLKILNLSPDVTKIVSTLLFAFVTIMGAIIASTIVIFLFSKYWSSKPKDSRNELTLIWISRAFKALIWGITLILFLENMGIKVNTLIAGLGIGGLALAFAAQAVLADIFCFFTIFFDKPFEIGDFIIVGPQYGTVEHIGVKTTRLRTLDGEQLLFSNTDLTNSRIRNFKTMEERRVLFTLGVEYSTTYDQLREIPGIIKKIIANTPETTFGRTHFVSYGAYSLNFEIAYYVLSSDFDKYLDIHQEVNLCIKEEFEKWDIQFAFPTQTIQLQNNP